MRYRAAKLASLIAFILLICSYVVSKGIGSSTGTEPQRTSQTTRKDRAAITKQEPAPYSKFSHNIPQHRQSCNSCHKFPTPNWKEARKGDDAFPDVTDYPQHSSCLNCHRRQFFSGSQPIICTICHTNPSPRDSHRHPFPNPPEIFDASEKGRRSVSEFGIYFPHEKHVDMVGQGNPKFNSTRSVRLVFASLHLRRMTDHQESEPKSCSVCHQTHQPEGESGEEFVTSPPKDLAEGDFWLKKGTFKTAPRTHAGCFMCHSAESGLTPTPSDCATCHKPLPPNQQLQLNQAHDDYDPKLTAAMGITDKLTLKLWSRRETARFRHEWAPHAVLSCVNCHNIAAINTADESTKRVPPLSCGGEGSGCHIDPAMEGTLNHEVEKKKSDPLFQCTKCHINNGKEPTPQSHLNLVAPAKKTS